MGYMAWLIIGIICGIIEVATMGFWFLWLALSALSVSLLTWLNVVSELPAQVIVFGIITIAFIILTRPLVVKLFKTHEVKSNVDALIGLTGTVIVDISPHDSGQVNLQGEIWTARADQEISENSSVIVKSVEGVTLYVEPVKNK